METGRLVGQLVETGRLVGQPVETGRTVGQPVETGRTVGQPVETGRLMGQLVETGRTVGQPVETGRMVGQPVETGRLMGQLVDLFKSSNHAYLTALQTTVPILVNFAQASKGDHQGRPSDEVCDISQHILEACKAPFQGSPHSSSHYTPPVNTLSRSSEHAFRPHPE